jgi:cytochrome P450
MLVEEAMDNVLWNNPPIANYATHFPLHDVDLDGVHVAANTPLVISFGAANNDPALMEERQTLSKGAHLAWGAGPHACPAKSPAQLIALTAIEKILNALHDLTLAVTEETLQWRPGPFHRALVALPVRFSPTPATRFAGPLPGAELPAAAGPAPVRVSSSAPTRPQAKKGFWSTFLDLFRV